MEIKKATLANLEQVKTITYNTINEIYPHYYPKGAVDFFLAHHKEERIKEDIIAGFVYLMDYGQDTVGTITIKKNEIGRFFVLPQFQRKGIGQALLEFAEMQIFQQYDVIRLDSSLSAKQMYVKRGYHEIESHSIVTENGDVLCYDVMEKRR